MGRHRAGVALSEPCHSSTNQRHRDSRLSLLRQSHQPPTTAASAPVRPVPQTMFQPNLDRLKVASPSSQGQYNEPSPASECVSKEQNAGWI